MIEAMSRHLCWRLKLINRPAFPQAVQNDDPYGASGVSFRRAANPANGWELPNLASATGGMPNAESPIGYLP